jgi:serine/tyrosine/threonine adenylyltransferase
MQTDDQPGDAAELLTLRFDDSFVRTLPGDPSAENRVRQVRGAAYSAVVPSAVRAPRTVAFSDEVRSLLGLSRAACESAAFAQVFAGNRLLPGMRPYAACYGGHQFGNWAAQLGDGRAITLGEALIEGGARLELQLKGAGKTPYSRTADGRAVLRSSLREFLCSEAMHHLGVPTTRALSLVLTGEQVLRDLLYDGNAREEPGAVVCRVAPSFVRFGNFELFAAREDEALLRALTDYVIGTHFPEIDLRDPGAYAAFFGEVARRTVDMVVHWMRVGFVHGVMNTDNMSILGLTIDYGPYGFLEPYDPDWTPNITDAGGRRYRYAHQPHVVLWNLARLAEALYPLIKATEPLESALSMSVERLSRGMDDMYAQKLGLFSFQREPVGADTGLASDQELVDQVLSVLSAREIDMTMFFRLLAAVDCDEEPSLSDAALCAPLLSAYYASPEAGAPAEMAGLLRRYAARVRLDGTPNRERALRMNAVNPKFVLRNYLAQLAIDDVEQGSERVLSSLLSVLRHPYDDQDDQQLFAEKRPEWARQRAGCSMLSCSS